MYVREKRVRRGDNEYRYFQLVQSTWVDGKSRQTVVKHLGRLPDREYADAFARRSGFLCGVVECPNAGALESEALFPRKGRRVKDRVMLCEDHDVAFRAGERVKAHSYRPEKVEAVMAAWRKPPAGGRPRYQPQSRESVLE
jgi:hypothetical protein